jgi:hypothetical protein
MRRLAVFGLLITVVVGLAAQGRPSPFPKVDVITGEPPLDALRLAWYSKQLPAMGESNLPKGLGESYRFLWLRSFDNPVAVRISDAGSQCVLVAKQLDGWGGYAPGRLSKRVARTLSLEDCASFKRLIAALGFWQPQPADPRDVDTVQVDGARWVLEGQRNADYHLWDVWSPSESGPRASFRRLCLEMIRLSGLTLNPKGVY